MNNKTYSVLAMASRCGKLLGALFSLIGFIVIVSTITEFINLGINSFSNIFSGSSYGNSEILGKAQTAMGAIDFMRAGAIILFICAVAAVVFNLLAKENIVGSVIDAALALVAFIMNFSMDIMSAAQSAIMSGSSSSAMAKVGANLVVAMIFILLIAILNIRAVFPTDSIITRIKGGASAAPKTAYANAYAPSTGYPQNANRAYNPNQAYPQNANQAYNPNQAYPQNANQAYNPNQAYPQGANQAYNPNQAYPQGANQAYNPNPAYPQNANQQFNPNQAYPQNANPQNPAGGYYQNNNRM
ncbi:MAG: DUF3824 domain-containing protein [Oscillospiraceae bacterium]|nr:DUF3824 domain-containing protein [Oscillospiraceae bacterium]